MKSCRERVYVSGSLVRIERIAMVGSCMGRWGACKGACAEWSSRTFIDSPCPCVRAVLASRGACMHRRQQSNGAATRPYRVHACCAADAGCKSCHRQLECRELYWYWSFDAKGNSSAIRRRLQGIPSTSWHPVPYGAAEASAPLDAAPWGAGSPPVAATGCTLCTVLALYGCCRLPASGRAQPRHAWEHALPGGPLDRRAPRMAQRLRHARLFHSPHHDADVLSTPSAGPLGPAPDSAAPGPPHGARSGPPDVGARRAVLALSRRFSHRTGRTVAEP